MYAKLVTKAGSPTLCFSSSTTNAVANIAVYFNTLIDVITGTITNVNSVNSTVFDTSLCEIVNNVATGWTLYDNTASNSIFVSTPAAPPVIIRAPYTDNASAYKYLWAGLPANTQYANGYGGVYIRWIPMEDWNPTTNTGTNQLIAISNTIAACSSFVNFYDCPAYSPSGTTPAYDSSMANAGLTTIISASQSHLYVWAFHDQYGTNTSRFLGNFLVSEYSRDDAWNTPENGFPSWGMWGCSGNGHSYLNDSGTIIRVLNPNTGQNSTHVAPYTSYNFQNYNYTLRGRLSSYSGAFANSSSPSSYALTNNNAPGSWGKMGTYPNYPPNNRDPRNNANNIGFAISDIRIVPTNGVIDGTYTSFYGVGPIAYGSITAKSPYIYLFRTQYQNLDEFSIDGVTYVNLITNNNSVTTNGSLATTVIVKKV